jgi:protease IV
MADRRSILGLALLLAFLLLCFGFVFALLRYGPGQVSDEDGPRVGVVRVEGVITSTSSRRAIEALRRFRKDTEIVAIVVRIDSPGGLVGPSQEVYREIERTRKTKHVVASLGSLAASGGYYIASACEWIVASSGSITGSIGVISRTTHFNELLALAKIETHTFTSGRFKDTGSPLREMRDDEKLLLESFVMDIYRQFLRDVARGRHLDEKRVREVADGRLLTGEKALESKLVDQIGNFSDALEVASGLAKAKGEPVPAYFNARRGLLAELVQDGLDGLLDEVHKALGESRRVEVREPSLE